MVRLEVTPLTHEPTGGGTAASSGWPAAWLRRAFDPLPDPVLLLSRDLEVRFASARVREVLGFEPDELVGRALTDLVAPEDVPTVLGIAAERLGTEAPALFRVRARHRDGRDLWVGVSAVDRSDDPEIRSVVVTVRDITRPGLRGEELARARDFYLTLLDGFPNPVWRSTTPLGVDWVNQAYLAFTGRSYQEELGEGWAEIVHPEDLPRVTDAFQRTFERREPFVLEYRLRHRSGEFRWIADHGQPIIGLDGEFLGHIGAFYDVHDRRQTEEVLRATVQELRLDLEALARVADERREAIARLLADEERRTRELADQIENDQLQALAALKLRVELLGERLREDPADEGLGVVMRSVEETMRRMRRLMRELREERDPS
ncbi:hypothetical protein HRbin12_01481 [bacterium HR12]|nr:hypothetical protein HRbin12_01481 [bacterium HR12]